MIDGALRPGRSAPFCWRSTFSRKRRRPGAYGLRVAHIFFLLAAPSDLIALQVPVVSRDTI